MIKIIILFEGDSVYDKNGNKLKGINRKNEHELPG